MTQCRGRDHKESRAMGPIFSLTDFFRMLRRRAAAKFGPFADRMLFTEAGLEQATRLVVARHRAARLRAFDALSLVDLGCGIGGDLLAAAETDKKVKFCHDCHEAVVEGQDAMFYPDEDYRVAE